MGRARGTGRRALNRGRDTPLHIAVNVSTRQFIDDDLPATVSQTLQETGCEPRWLSVEITESALWFRNQAVMGSYTEALAQGGTPDIGRVRREQSKTGWGFTLMAPLSDDAGLFLRSSANDGQTETYAFTEIDRQTAVGGQFGGARHDDRWGLGLAINELSPAHRDYLAAGGQGFFLGDGRLNYAPEQVLEAWYRWALPDVTTRAGAVQSTISLGWQHIRNPGYNQDRGPVQVYSLRWHSAF